MEEPLGVLLSSSPIITSSFSLHGILKSMDICCLASIFKLQPTMALHILRLFWLLIPSKEYWQLGLCAPIWLEFKNKIKSRRSSIFFFFNSCLHNNKRDEVSSTCIRPWKVRYMAFEFGLRFA